MKVNIQYGVFRCLNSSGFIVSLGLKVEERPVHTLFHNVLYPLSMGQLSLYKVIVDGDSLSFGQIAFGDAHVDGVSSSLDQTALGDEQPCSLQRLTPQHSCGHFLVASPGQGW